MSEKKEIEEKPLEKMTAKELREVAADIPEITGASGMKKDELLEAIKKAKGVAEEKNKDAGGSGPDPKKKTKTVESVADLKKKIKALKSQKTDARSSGDRKTAKIYRRRINRLKKKTRRAA